MKYKIHMFMTLYNEKIISYKTIKIILKYRSNDPEYFQSWFKLIWNIHLTEG